MKRRRILFLLFVLVFSTISILCQNTPTSDRVFIKQLHDARFITISPGGIIYVYEKSRNAILKYSSAGESLATLSGFALSKNSFAEPTDICSPSDLDLFLSDYTNHRIIQYDRSLNVTAIWQSDNQYSSMNNIFRYPKSIDIDHLGKLYLIDGENNRIVKIGHSQKVERTFGGFDAGKGRLLNPKRIRVNNIGNIFVQDNNRIIVFDQLGNYISTIADDSVKSMISFCMYDNEIIVIDSCKLVKMRKEGVITSVKRLETIEDLKDYDEPVDIKYQNKILYLLSRKELIGIPVDILFK
ncbi:MAG: NHL repeat-containing protein [Ignavibacteriales bacterium]|nr:NHL repeat-containing protein [Ignavibacteriales bacterium]